MEYDRTDVMEGVPDMLSGWRDATREERWNASCVETAVQAIKLDGRRADL